MSAGVPGCLPADNLCGKPIDEIAKVNDDRLRALARFALGIAVEGEDPLNENDAMIFSFLSRVEMKRR